MPTINEITYEEALNNVLAWANLVGMKISTGRRFDVDIYELTPTTMHYINYAYNNDTYWHTANIYCVAIRPCAFFCALSAWDKITSGRLTYDDYPKNKDTI